MREEARSLLKKYYGYTSFRQGQEKIITSILDGSDTLAIMPTGAGKSICFQIPALMQCGITLVISPLISLMKDQVDALTSAGIPATFINSTLDYKEVEDRLKKAENGLYKLLYIAPERLESESFCGYLENLQVSLIAVDEAHCVSQWGHDFRPSYRSIGRLVKSFKNRPIVSAFTATATSEVKQDIIDLLYMKNPNAYVTGFDRENLFFSVIRGENKKDFIEKYIEDNKGLSGIIYSATRKEVDSIYYMLKKKGYSVGRYHAGLKDEERVQVQEAFLYDDIRIMIATNAFGMGIDKSNVRYVIHYNMPKNMESYYQEAGRAGRDGDPSECILLFGPQDVVVQKFLIEQTIFSPERRDNEFKKLQAMVDYCHTSRCNRKYILEYFGETQVSEECGNCGNCRNDVELSDVTIEAQKIFSCILRMKGKYGTSLVADVLKGSKNKRIVELGFDNLSTHGIMKEYSAKEIRDLINLFIAEEYLYLVGTQYPVVRMREKAVPVLKGSEKVFQRVAVKKEKAVKDDSLFEILKDLRHYIAQEEKVPPYIVFSDATLREMSSYCPMDEKSMLSIKGVGEVKFEKYGDQFINAIQSYFAKTGKEPPQVSISEPQALEEQEDVPSYIVSLNLFKDGNSLKEIARVRGLKEMTIQDHLIRCSAEGMDVDLSPLIPKEYESLIFKKIEELGGENLKPIKEALPEEVDYMAIKAAIVKYAALYK